MLAIRLEAGIENKEDRIQNTEKTKKREKTKKKKNREKDNHPYSFKGISKLPVRIAQ